jgi:DNA polymerase III epsilon subunit-like protein
VKRQEKNAKARLATQQKKHAKNFYVLDTETTGLNNKELIEVSAILFKDGKEV